MDRNEKNFYVENGKIACKIMIISLIAIVISAILIFVLRNTGIVITYGAFIVVFIIAYWYNSKCILNIKQYTYELRIKKADFYSGRLMHYLTENNIDKVENFLKGISFIDTKFYIYNLGICNGFLYKEGNK